MLRGCGYGAHGAAQGLKPPELAVAGIDGDVETVTSANFADTGLAVVNGEFGLWGVVRTLHVCCLAALRGLNSVGQDFLLARIVGGIVEMRNAALNRAAVCLNSLPLRARGFNAAPD